MVHVPDGQDKPYRANGRVYVRFVITFRSIAPREGVAVPADIFGALVERGEINERQYKGL